MAKGRKTIGLFICHLDNDYAYDICKGVDYAAKELDVNLVIFPGMYINAAYNDPDHAKFDYQYNSVFYYAKPESIDALIVSIGTIGSFLDYKDNLAFLEQFKDIPILTLEAEYPGYPSLIIDSSEGLKAMLNHLIHDHNKKHIGFVSGRPGNADAEERLKVFKSTITEAGLPLDESMIVHGNFSEFCEDLVEDLLDRHPEIDALCFANDQMALGGYNVLKRRGIKIGTDIAVTGFDDVPLALALQPALSTVRANACELGYQSIKQALNLIKKGHTTVSRLSSTPIMRESCGCGTVITDYNPEQAAKLLALSREDLIEYIIDNTFADDKDTFIYHRIHEIMSKYIAILLTCILDGDPYDATLHELLATLRTYSETDVELYYSIMQLNYCVHNIEGILLTIVKDSRTRYKLTQLSSEATTHLLSAASSLRYNDRKEHKVNNWTACNIVRDTIINYDNLDLAYNQIVEKLQKLNITSSYIYIANQEILMDENNQWSIPDQLRLMVYSKDQVTIALTKEEHMVEVKKLFRNPYLPQKRRFTLIITPIFTTEEQHGIFLCETDIHYFHHIYSIDLELGTTLKFIKMMEKQHQMNQQLEYTLSVLHEKNRQLSKISTIDELTGLKNRRGFMSESQAVISSEVNVGQRALLLFADMDNLKSVNDMFGHEDGDFALKTIATALKTSMRNDDIIGRIGGDEFVAFALLGRQQSADTIANRIHDKLTAMNEISEKPYYIEASIGYVDFICDDKTSIQTLLKQADDALYEQKSHKRKSVLKESDPAQE